MGFLLCFYFARTLQVLQGAEGEKKSEVQRALSSIFICRFRLILCLVFCVLCLMPCALAQTAELSTRSGCSIVIKIPKNVAQTAAWPILKTALALALVGPDDCVMGRTQ